MIFKSAYIGLDEAAKMKCFQPLIDAFAERHSDRQVNINGATVWRADSAVQSEADGLGAYVYYVEKLYRSDDYGFDWMVDTLVGMGYSREMLEKVQEDYFKMKESYFNEASI